MRTAHPVLTPNELAIMNVVWRLKTATVRDIWEHLRQRRTIAYTTVMTMMRILEGKGYITKSTGERAYVYKPAKSRDQVVGSMVRDFLDRVFDGAPNQLLLHLARNNRLTPAQRRIVQQLIDEADE
jgi:predicted transcriptional regulator